jgi:cytochrome c peroxidase
MGTAMRSCGQPGATQVDCRAESPSRTSPLRGIWQHPPYFHNGTTPTLEAVVQTYNERKTLGLTTEEMADLVQYLKSP